MQILQVQFQPLKANLYLLKNNKEVAFLVLYGGEKTEDATICIK